MKAILEFNLDDSSDAMSHLRCIKSPQLALVLWDICYIMSKAIENKLDLDNNSTEKQYELLDDVRVFIHEAMKNRGIVLDELVE